MEDDSYWGGNLDVSGAGQYTDQALDWQRMGDYDFGPVSYDSPAPSSYGQISGDYSPGSGAYTVGDTQYDITAPGGGSGDQYYYDANAIYGPRPGGGSSYTDAVRAAGQREAEGQFAQMNSWGAPGGGGGGTPFGAQPGRSAGGFTPQPFQRIGLGQPERTLYDRYKSMLLNPEQMTSDPAYQFLFNQGQSALNRSLAAKRLTYSGKALNDTMNFGQGMAGDWFKRLIPQYQAGAEEELKRFMGPAGLLPGYAGVNNRASEAEGGAAASRELLPMYRQMLAGGSGGGGGYSEGGGSFPSTPAIGYGGIGSGYTRRLDPSTFSGGGNEDILTALEREGYGDY